MKILVLTFILMIPCSIYAQKVDSLNEIIDPIEIPCYELSPNGAIKIYKDSSDYIGRVFFQAKIDTINNILTDYKIIYAKLFSRNNPKDSIVISPNVKAGNYQYLKILKPKLIKHLDYLKVVKNSSKDCFKNGSYNIPVTIK